MGKLDGKVALISGGARGQGEAEARLFAREGAAVVLGDVLEEEGRRVAESIIDTGGQATFAKLDVSDQSNWAELVDLTVEQYGRWFDAFITAAEVGLPFDVVSGYRGTGESLPGLLRGDYDVFLQPIDHPSIVPYLKTNEIRPVLDLAGKRSVNAPDVPTARDAGYDFTLASSRHMAAPPGTPADRAKILETALLKAMNDKEFTDFLLKSGLVLDPGDAKRARKDIDVRAALYRKYIDEMKKVLKMK